MAKKNSVAEPVETISQIDAPYELPEGWKWVQIQDLVNIYLGLTHTPNYSDSGIPFLSVKDMSDGYINFSNTKYISEEEYNSFPNGAKPKKGDILFARAGTIGIPQIIDTNQIFGIFVSLGYFRLIDENPDTKKYIVNWMNSILFEHQVNKNIKGSTIKNLNTGWLKKFVIPLPPNIEEQQRIVNRIESMFAKLDEAKEKAQNVVDSFETRKATILHQAFTGNLTAKWRKENGIPDDSWEEKNLEEISTKITDGEHITPKRVDSYCGYYLLSARNILNGSIKLDDVDYVGKEEFDRIRRRCNPEKNDILISCSGSVGRVCVIKDDNQYVMVRSAAMIKVKESNPFFVAYMLQSHNVQQQIEKTKKQSCQANLFLGAIKELHIPVPEILEQQEIVRILDTVLEKECIAKSAAEQVIEQINLLKKSILARAFRGEL